MSCPFAALTQPGHDRKIYDLTGPEALSFEAMAEAIGHAIDRKVTLTARSLADLTSQNLSVTDPQLTAYLTVSQKILWPYTNTPRATITELHIEPGSLAARVQWSVGSNQHSAGSVLTIPSELRVSDTYLIYSEVTYTYVPTVGYLLAKAGIDLSDVAFTRPRMSSCVLYNVSSGACPTL